MSKAMTQGSLLFSMGCFTMAGILRAQVSDPWFVLDITGALGAAIVLLVLWHTQA